MMKATVPILIAFTILLAACTKGNDQKPPVYYVPPSASAA
jgi:hypothetical protein